MNETKAVARDFYESYNERDLDASFGRFISSTCIVHAPGGDEGSLSGWLDYDKMLFPAFPEFRAVVLDQVSEGDKVATRWAFHVVQGASFAGIESRGNSATLSGTAVDRIVDGKIVEHWIDLDFMGFLGQLSA